MLPCWIECFRKTEKEKKIHKLQKQNCPFSKNIYSTKLRLNFHHANVVIWKKKKTIYVRDFFVFFFYFLFSSFHYFFFWFCRTYFQKYLCFQFSVFSYNFFSSFVSFTFIYVIFGDIYDMCSPVHQSVFFINVVVCMYIYFKRCLVLKR